MIGMREYKLVVLGSGGVGKSALTVQFVSDVFVQKYDPTIEDLYRKQTQINGQPAILEILDTAGTEQFASMRDLYMKNGQGFILVYSITSQASFNDLIELRDQILRVKDTPNVPMVLVGNKSDLEDERVVSKERGQALAREFNCTFMETSAKNRVNVDEIFLDLVRQINRSIPNSNSQQAQYGNNGQYYDPNRPNQNQQGRPHQQQQQQQQQQYNKPSQENKKSSCCNFL